jgi:hypothetical protein
MQSRPGQPKSCDIDGIVRKIEPTTNPRGIPLAPFVDDVQEYVTDRTEVEGVLRNFQEMIAYVEPKATS